MKPAAIIVCGGRSSRMVAPKADLPLEGEPLLLRTVCTASLVASPVFAAAAADQSLPPLPSDVVVVHDPQPFCGPLAAFAAALAAIPEQCQWTFLLAGDLPFLTPKFLRLLDGMRHGDAVVPHDGQRWHPLTAIYRRSVLSTANRLLTAKQVRMIDLIEALDVRAIREADWLACDPDSQCLRNVNTPADYGDALRVLAERDRVTRP